MIVAIVLILAVSAGLRLWRLGYPAEYMFDEIYYAKDAKAIADGRVGPNDAFHWMAGDATSWPHPEMGKLAIAGGIILFGDRAFGWRLPAALAGMVILACVYPIGRRLGLSRSWALVALLFAAADPLGITQSRIAMLDIFVAMWTVLCVYLALRYIQDGRHLRWLFLCGAAGGLALATKWSGALALFAAGLIVFGAWVARRVEDRAQRRASTGAPDQALLELSAEEEPPSTPAASPSPGRRVLAGVVALLPVIVALALVPAIIYMAAYTQYFLKGHSLADWRELQRQMWIFGVPLDAEHSYASIAPSWIIDYRPVWYFFQGTEEYRGVVAIGNPFLWWTATLAFIAAPVVAILRRGTALLVPAAIVAALYLPWFAATRTSFLFYMTPVAPFLAVLVAVALAQLAGTIDLSRGRWLVVAVAAIATAVLWSPIARLAERLFWHPPQPVSPTLGWVVAGGIAALLTVLVVIILASPRLRRWRPLVATAAAGLVIGIVVAFLPVVLAIPISPEELSRITWFPSWI